MWAVLPLKSLHNAKHRLSPLLTLNERRDLVLAMAQDVITALLACSYVENILLISKEPYAVELAKTYNIAYLNSPLDTDLNSAIQASAIYLQELKIQSNEQQQADDMLVAHGDIPQLTAAEITDICAQHYKHKNNLTAAVSVVSDTLGEGSNLMICSPPTAIPFSYGHNSLHSHRASAAKLNIPFQQIRCDNISADVDRPEDLAKLFVQLHNARSRDAKRNSFTLNYLENSDLISKLIPLLEPSLVPATVLSTALSTPEMTNTKSLPLKNFKLMV